MPTCSPTRRTLYFGDFYARQSGEPCAAADGQEPPAGAVSVAQVLDAYTHALLGKWHVGANPVGPWQEVVIYRGWETCRWTPANITSCGGASYINWRYLVGASDMGSALDYQPRVELEDFHDVWPTMTAPRFLVYSANLAHGPFHVPQADQLPPGYPTGGITTPRQRYEAMIAALDWQFGEILAAAPDAVVIVVGDNGTPDNVAPDPLKAKTTTFQRGIHVPLWIGGPGVSVGQSAALVHAVDLFATIAELAGEMPPVTDSRSLMPLVNGAVTKIRDHAVSGVLGGNTPDDRACRGGTAGRYKLRQWRALPGNPWTEELYDLLVDPGETVNLVALPEHAAKVAQYRAILEVELP
jgi:arylsulfatase A-like enzyme